LRPPKTRHFPLPYAAPAVHVPAGRPPPRRTTFHSLIFTHAPRHRQPHISARQRAASRDFLRTGHARRAPLGRPSTIAAVLFLPRGRARSADPARVLPHATSAPSRPRGSASSTRPKRWRPRPYPRSGRQEACVCRGARYKLPGRPASKWPNDHSNYGVYDSPTRVEDVPPSEYHRASVPVFADPRGARYKLQNHAGFQALRPRGWGPAVSRDVGPFEWEVLGRSPGSAPSSSLPSALYLLGIKCRPGMQKGPDFQPSTSN